MTTFGNCLGALLANVIRISDNFELIEARFQFVQNAGDMDLILNANNLSFMERKSVDSRFRTIVTAVLNCFQIWGSEPNFISLCTAIVAEVYNRYYCIETQGKYSRSDFKGTATVNCMIRPSSVILKSFPSTDYDSM